MPFQLKVVTTAVKKAKISNMPSLFVGKFLLGPQIQPPIVLFFNYVLAQEALGLGFWSSKSSLENKMFQTAEYIGHALLLSKKVVINNTTELDSQSEDST